MEDYKVIRPLTDGEIKTITTIVLASDVENKCYLIEYIKSAMVTPINEDGSIVRFWKNEKMLDWGYQGELLPTGFVEDRFGTPGEVLLFIDSEGNLTEFEIVSYEAEDIQSPLWETFRLV
jgi:hypothetical protein